ncbi:MAG: hypothetical protein ACIAS6_14480 [Phycisphaerales bacterium JB060]
MAGAALGQNDDSFDPAPIYDPIADRPARDGANYKSSVYPGSASDMLWEAGPFHYVPNYRVTSLQYEPATRQLSLRMEEVGNDEETRTAIARRFGPDGAAVAPDRIPLRQVQATRLRVLTNVGQDPEVTLFEAPVQGGPIAFSIRVPAEAGGLHQTLTDGAPLVLHLEVSHPLKRVSVCEVRIAILRSAVRDALTEIAGDAAADDERIAVAVDREGLLRFRELVLGRLLVERNVECEEQFREEARRVMDQFFEELEGSRPAEEVRSQLAEGVIWSAGNMNRELAPADVDLLRTALTTDEKFSSTVESQVRTLRDMAESSETSKDFHLKLKAHASGGGGGDLLGLLSANVNMSTDFENMTRWQRDQLEEFKERLETDESFSEELVRESYRDFTGRDFVGGNRPLSLEIDVLQQAQVASGLHAEFRIITPGEVFSMVERYTVSTEPIGEPPTMPTPWGGVQWQAAALYNAQSETPRGRGYWTSPGGKAFIPMDREIVFEFDKPHVVLLGARGIMRHDGGKNSMHLNFMDNAGERLVFDSKVPERSSPPATQYYRVSTWASGADWQPFSINGLHEFPAGRHQLRFGPYADHDGQWEFHTVQIHAAAFPAAQRPDSESQRQSRAAR